MNLDANRVIAIQHTWTVHKRIHTRDIEWLIHQAEVLFDVNNQSVEYESNTWSLNES